MAAQVRSIKASLNVEVHDPDTLEDLSTEDAREAADAWLRESCLPGPWAHEDTWRVAYNTVRVFYRSDHHAVRGGDRSQG